MELHSILIKSRERKHQSDRIIAIRVLDGGKKEINVNELNE